MGTFEKSTLRWDGFLANTRNAYTGEANIIDDHLNEFLDIAEDLKVKGLTLEKSVDEQPKSHPTTPASLQDGKAQELGSSRQVWHSQDPKATDDRAPAPDVSHLRSDMSATSQGAAHTEVNPPTPKVLHLRSVMSAASQGPAATKVHPPTAEVSRLTPHHGHVATQGRASHLHGVMFDAQGTAAIQERSSINPHSVTYSSNGNKFPQYDCGNQDDHDDAGYIKVEVGDPSDYNVYCGMNEHGESYISDVSQRVDDKTGGAANGESLSTEQQITEIKVEVIANEQSVDDWYKQNDENDTIMAQDEDDYFQVESKVVDRAFENQELAHNSLDDNMPDEEQDLFEKKSHTAENPFKCLVCLKVLSTSSSLNRHKRMHTGEKPYQCQVCSKMFTYYETLAQHKRVHTGEKPYRCPQCPKSFSEKSKLDMHIRVHTGEKPYHCPHCPKTFSQKGNLDHHIGVHRKKKNCSM